MLAGEHVNDARAADARFHQHKAGMVGSDFADHGSLFAKGVRLHRGKNARAVSTGYDRQQLAFVGDVERVKPKNLTGAFDLLADWYARFVKEHSDVRGLGNFTE